MSRKVTFVETGWADYTSWLADDRRLLAKINRLIGDIVRNGQAEGIGKPEPLRANLAGYRSRRIDQEHRLVYRATDDEVVVIACRGHDE
ncbi:Txe/YoeB family addiction module toxin [Nocardia caishijiensis]|uniref:Endoribonuclease YoeB n=1 Tax=Nocardia caishijiensis TaxID=184756 RepID=A0ABQ6YS58_9NOCA|nr:Txe/YoeB family addiction module toxin [Nocardia caishijiensis]KAF0848657.1 toxin YoeB [Nocardia caishijiensis]